MIILIFIIKEPNFFKLNILKGVCFCIMYMYTINYIWIWNIIINIERRAILFLFKEVEFTYFS